MTSYFRNVALIFCTLLFINLNWTCTALKCYQCQLKDGVGDAGCGENPPPENFLRDCAQPQCWLRYSNNGTLSVERFCVALANNENGCVKTYVTDVKGINHDASECRCSDSDGCNGYSPSTISGQEATTTEQS